MRILKGDEKDNSSRFMRAAKDQTLSARCKTTQRGIALVVGDEIVGLEFNGPHEGYECDPNMCGYMCQWYSVTAEDRAAQDAAQKGKMLSGAMAYVAEKSCGRLTPIDLKSYARQATDLFNYGVKGVVMARHGRIAFYETAELREVTMTGDSA